MFPKIEISHDALRLHPPVTVRIHLGTCVSLTFVASVACPASALLIYHSPLRSKTLRRRLHDLRHQRLHAGQNVGLPQHQRRLMQQPRSLDVMSVGNYVISAVPRVVKKQLQVPVSAENIFLKHQDQPTQTSLQQRILPHAEQACVCLQHMKMGVHGLAFVGILVAQAHVLDRLPVARERLEISVLHRVETVLFDRMKQLHCIFQGLGISARTMEFRQTIYRKCYCIYLLLRVCRREVCVKRPEGSAVFLVVESVDDESLCAQGHIHISLQHLRPA